MPTLADPLQAERTRCDIHAVLQHIIFGQVWLEKAGRMRFGLDPNHPVF